MYNQKTPNVFIYKCTQFVARCAGLLVLLILADLAIRAVLRLEPRWDTFMYHLPFAALRGQLDIPYDMNDKMFLRYQGFPFLPHFLQGVLWKLTGSVNATGVINYLAFGAFLAYCHYALNARVSLVALIALTAPLVIIHTTTSYIDLFGNSLLAMGFCSAFFCYFFPEQATQKQLLIGLSGFIGAAWSKFLLAPLAGLGILGIMLISWKVNGKSNLNLTTRNLLSITLTAIVLAGLPYFKNWYFYANPFWPIRMPILGDYFPFAEKVDFNVERPIELRNLGQFKLFLHSLFEINHPIAYTYRPRWIIDQGNAAIAFRMGGFWFGWVVFYIPCMLALLVITNKRTGTIASISILALLGFTGLLPQSNELRYYLYIPLTCAAIIGMLYPLFKQKYPGLALLLLINVIGLWSYMLTENWVHYRLEKIDYQNAAEYWNIPRWWMTLQTAKHYCVVDMLPIGILLSGPTLSEFRITDRSKESYCPSESIIVDKQGVHDEHFLLNESLQLFKGGKYFESIAASQKALRLKADFAEAYNNLCVAYIKLNLKKPAINACQQAINLNTNFPLARNNLAWAESL